MKITLPAITMEEVGIRYGADTYFHATNRPNRYGKETKVYEPRLTSFTALDYDFKAARRAVGVGHLMAYTAFVAAVFPMAVLYVAGECIGRGMMLVGERLGDAIDDLGIPVGWTVKSTYAAIIKGIIAR